MAISTGASSGYAALLRGVNVGGKNKLPMRELSTMFTDAGCTDVAHYIQSGNVVFRAPASVSERIAAVIEERVQARFGFTPPVVVRTKRELASVVRENPFVARGEDEAKLFVMFLAERPSASRVAALDPRRSQGDEFIVKGKDIFMCLGAGAAKTKLTNDYFDRTLATTSTSRNWRTVQKLLELLA